MNTDINKKNSTLFALTASALALPGVSSDAHADSAPDKSEVGYRFSFYTEDDLPEERLGSGSGDRYDIQVHQFRLMMPLSSNLSFAVDSSYESMSGSSPFNSSLDSNDQTVVAMSQATIDESRTDGTFTPTYYFGSGSVSASVGFSTEEDYDSISGGLSGKYHFLDNMYTVSGGLSFSSDEIRCSDDDINAIGGTTYCSIPNDDRTEEKETLSTYLGLSRVLSPMSVMQMGLGYTRQSGYLDQPYRVAERRPDERDQYTFTLGLRKYAIEFDSAVHADYRYYSDTFGINSHTLEFAYYQNIRPNGGILNNDGSIELTHGPRPGSNRGMFSSQDFYYQLVPSVRYYAQSEADFYTVNDQEKGAAEFTSSDSRLAGYGAWGLGMKLVAHYKDVSTSLSLERYISDTEYGLDGFGVDKTETELPSALSYSRFSFGVDYKF